MGLIYKPSGHDTMKIDYDKCRESVSGIGGWHFFQCSRNKKVERDGIGYCGTHDPVAVKKRDKKRDDEYNRKLALRHAHSHRNCIDKKKVKALVASVRRNLYALEKNPSYDMDERNAKYQIRFYRASLENAEQFLRTALEEIEVKGE